MDRETPSTAERAEPGHGSLRLLLPFGHFFFKYRDFLFPAVFFGLVLLSRPLLPEGTTAERLLDVLGILVALSGQVLRACVIGLAYIRRGGLQKKVHADELVTEGIFAHSRNPLYLGNFLALVGFSLIYNSWLCYVVGIPFFALAYLAIVVAEEDFLRRKFGPAYDDYCRRVNRFFPSLRGLRATLAGSTFDWKRVLRKEYGSTFAGILSVLILVSWEEVVQLGYVVARPTIVMMAVIAACLVPPYLGVRHLKKSGALGRFFD